MKKISVSCIGLGMRANIYLSLMHSMNDDYEIISLCDKLQTKIDYFNSQFHVNSDNCFLNEDDFFSKKRSDLCMIMTQDKDHVGHLIKALKCGYKNILIEKPFCTTEEEIALVAQAVKEYPADIYVCHVLRYAPAFLKAKELIDNGEIGELKSIDGLERISFGHFAHSYVRGHFSIKAKSSPMIMAKCCHDLDLMVWYANSLCESLSSYGDLTYFVKDNKPEGSSDRCYNCKLKNSCYYSTENIYFNVLKWAKEYASYIRPLTDEILREDLKINQFGRCVFSCDNDVCDEQTVAMKFKNGIIAHLKATAFTPNGGRKYEFFGTKGSILLDEYNGKLTLTKSNGENEEFEISQLVDAKAGHGGGDKGLIENLKKMVRGEITISSTKLEYSLESHKMALAAEKSRIDNGATFKF